MQRHIYNQPYQRKEVYRIGEDKSIWSTLIKIFTTFSTRFFCCLQISITTKHALITRKVFTTIDIIRYSVSVNAKNLKSLSLVCSERTPPFYPLNFAHFGNNTDSLFCWFCIFILFILKYWNSFIITYNQVLLAVVYSWF